MKTLIATFFVLLAALGFSQAPLSRAGVNALLPNVVQGKTHIAEYTMQEQAGTTLVDHSGSGNNGTFATGSNAPSWNGLGLFMTSQSSPQWVSLPAKLNAAVTVQLYVMPQALNFSTGIVQGGGGYMAALAPAGGGSPAIIMNQVEGTEGAYISPWLWNGAAGTLAVNNQGWSAGHLYTFIFGNGTANDQVWIDGVQMAYGIQVDSNILTSGNWQLGGNTAGFAFTGTIGYAEFYSAPLTPTQIIQNSNYINAAMSNRGANQYLPVASLANVIDFCGDSITRGQGVGNAYCTATSLGSLNSTWTLNCDAVSGTGTAFIDAYAESAYVPQLSLYGQNIVSIFAGTNNYLYSETAQEAYYHIVHAIKTMKEKANGASIKFIVCTMLSRTGEDAFHDTLNGMLRTNWPSFADALVDFASDPNIGADGAYASTTYFQDGTHPTQLEQTAMGGYMRLAINALYNHSGTNPTKTTSNAYTEADADVYLIWQGTANGTVTLPTAIGYTTQTRTIDNPTAFTCTVTLTGTNTTTYQIPAGGSATFRSNLVSAATGGCNWGLTTKAQIVPTEDLFSMLVRGQTIANNYAFAH